MSCFTSVGKEINFAKNKNVIVMYKVSQKHGNWFTNLKSSNCQETVIPNINVYNKG